MNNKECRKIIGKTILKYRTEMHLNQRELGLLAFGHRNANDQLVISKLENGTRDLTTAELINLARVFKLSPSKFLSIIVENTK